MRMDYDEEELLFLSVNNREKGRTSSSSSS